MELARLSCLCAMRRCPVSWSAKNGFGYYRSTTGFMAFEPSRCDDRVGELEAVLVYSFSCSFSIDEFRGLKKTKSVGFRRLYGLA